jgi:hypothetical protein
MRETQARAVAYIEAAWLDRLRCATIWRHEMPVDRFGAVGEIGMWIAKEPVLPQRVEGLGQLDHRLADAQIELRILDASPGLTAPMGCERKRA